MLNKFQVTSVSLLISTLLFKANYSGVCFKIYILWQIQERLYEYAKQSVSYSTKSTSRFCHTSIINNSVSFFLLLNSLFITFCWPFLRINLYLILCAFFLTYLFIRGLFFLLWFTFVWITIILLLFCLLFPHFLVNLVRPSNISSISLWCHLFSTFLFSWWDSL